MSGLLLTPPVALAALALLTGRLGRRVAAADRALAGDLARLHALQAALGGLRSATERTSGRQDRLRHS